MPESIDSFSLQELQGKFLISGESQGNSLLGTESNAEKKLNMKSCMQHMNPKIQAQLISLFFFSLLQVLTVRKCESFCFKCVTHLNNKKNAHYGLQFSLCFYLFGFLDYFTTQEDSQTIHLKKKEFVAKYIEYYFTASEASSMCFSVQMGYLVTHTPAA